MLPDWVVESEARENTTAWLGTHPGEKAVKSKALALQRKHPKLSWPAATAQAQRIVKKERVATETKAIKSGPAVSVVSLVACTYTRKLVLCCLLTRLMCALLWVAGHLEGVHQGPKGRQRLGRAQV